MATTTTTENTEVVKALRQVVADSYMLLGETHLCHWNVRGPNFFALHTAFEEQYTELFTAIDEVAERIRALDADAPGGLRRFVNMASFEGIGEDADAQAMVKHIAECNQALVKNLKIARTVSEEAGDDETNDLMIARIQVHEKHIWMLKSFLA